MKIAITGHTKGIGQAIVNCYSNHEIIGFSRSNGYDISKAETVNEIINLSKDCDVFINNAYNNLSQVTLFERMLELWRFDLNKTIINVNSKTIYNPPNGRDYTKFKKVLRSSAIKAIEDIDRKCRIININPGYIKTDMTETIHSTYKMLTPEQAANIVKWCLDQPQEIEIGEISFWCTTL